MEQRRVLIHLLSANKWGGAQRYAFDICRHYLARGWRVAAVTRDAKVIDDHFRAASVPLVHAPLRGFFDPASAIILAKLLKGTPRDMTYVHVHRYRDAFTVLLAKRLIGRPDIRVISTRHTVRRGRNSWLFRRIYSKVNAHIFVSQAAFGSFASTWRSLPMPRETVHTLHNSLALDPGLPVAPPDRGPVCAIYTGPLASGKGIETIIDAMATLRDLKLRLRIAGKGNPDYIDTLRRRAQRRGVMDMIDWKSTPDIDPALISQSHFAVLPSVEREAFGMANLYAMSVGRPVICSANGAQSEYLDDGVTALFANPADASSLAAAMRRLATDPALRRDMGAAAYRKFAADLSWPHFISRLDHIYTSC